MARRRDWTIDEWQEFAVLVRSIRDEIDALILGIPETQGLTCRHINGLIRAADKFKVAMLSAEHVFAEQHPDWNDRAIEFIHGKGGTIWVPCKGKSRQSEPPLARSQWIKIGDRIKATLKELAIASAKFQETATKKRATTFFAACESLSVARVAMDGLVCSQNPDWTDAVRVFYGAIPPKA